MTSPSLRIEFALLGLLALLWGSSYLFIKVAVAEVPPLTLSALRVTGAAVFLVMVMRLRSERLPSDWETWRRLLLQAVFNSIGAWTVLAWGQQFVEAGLGSVLNSTSPIFVLLITGLLTRHETVSAPKLFGASLGLLGVAMIVGFDALRGLGDQIAGQLACLLGAVFYAGAAIHAKHFTHLAAVTTATGTMIWATAVLVPLAVFVDRPWTLSPSIGALSAIGVLSIACTGAALLIYFRLARTLGSIGVASQSYLRASVGVLLGMVFLGETFSLPIALGLCSTVLGVLIINWPRKRL